MRNTNKEKNEDASSKWPQLIVTIIVALITLAGVILTCNTNLKIQESKEMHEKQMEEQKNAYEQEFFMSEQSVTRAGIECIRYEIASAPPINGFHIRPYVYVIIEWSEEKRYIPVEGQFLQEEYAAEQDGICILYREDTTKQLLDSLEEQGCDAQLECMVAIEYTVEGKAQRDIYTLRTGQLEVAEEKKSLAVLNAWERLDDYVKIDMMFWPVGSQEQLKELLETIG